jgi:hypothetical protein
MNSFHFDPWMESKARQNERLAEAEKDRLAREALQARAMQDDLAAHILAQVGRKLADLGQSLEERYGASGQAECVTSQRNYSG